MGAYNDLRDFDPPVLHLEARLHAKLDRAEMRIESLEDELFAAKEVLRKLIREYIASDDWCDTEVEEAMEAYINEHNNPKEVA